MLHAFPISSVFTIYPTRLILDYLLPLITYKLKEPFQCRFLKFLLPPSLRHVKMSSTSLCSETTPIYKPMYPSLYNVGLISQGHSLVSNRHAKKGISKQTAKKHVKCCRSPLFIFVEHTDTCGNHCQSSTFSTSL